MKKINLELDNLPKLPNSIIKINNICNSNNTSIKNLIDEIIKDSSASATILKISNNAIFTRKPINSLQKAVVLLGKELTKTFLLNNAINNIFDIDFKPYNISINDYMIYNTLRAKIAYSLTYKQDKDTRNLLTTVSQLSSIGQILVSENIIKNNKTQDFKEDLEYGEDLDYAEKTYTETTSMEVSYKLLSNWNINNDITNILKYSQNLNTVQKAIKNNESNLNLIIKNFLIINSIKFNGHLEFKKEYIQLAKEHNINYKIIQNEIERIQIG
jgi:HD-like signal output (HDOD) protein